MDQNPQQNNGFQPETPQPAPTSQESAGQPQMPQSAQPQPTSTPTPTAENPGKTLGIISIVLDFIGFSLIGLILGIISRKKSKAAGQSATVGTVGMVLGIIITVISVLVWLTVAVLFIINAPKAAKNEATYAANNAATSFVQDANNYYAKAFSYPATVADFEKYPDSSLKSDKNLNGYSIVDTTPTSSTQLEYKRCSDSTAFVSYFDASKGTVQTTPLGAETVNC